MRGAYDEDGDRTCPRPLEKKETQKVQFERSIQNYWRLFHFQQPVQETVLESKHESVCTKLLRGLGLSYQPE